MRQLRVAVLGGGVTGVTVAIKLAKESGISVDLFEREKYLGGLEQSVAINNLVYDIGAFLFVQTNEFLRAFPGIEKEFIKVAPVTMRITPKGKIDYFPFSIQQYIFENGYIGTAYSVADRFVSKLRFTNSDNTQEWASYYMGKHLYERTGLKNYIRRLYDRDDTEIAIDFGIRRLQYLKLLSLPGIISTFIRNSFLPKKNSGNLVLARPVSGFQSVFNGVMRQLETEGVKMNLQTTLKKIQINDDMISIDTDGVSRGYDKLISTIPVQELLDLLRMESYASYEYMDLVSLFYQGKLNYPGEVLYNYSCEGKWKRLISYSRLYKMTIHKDHFTEEITVKNDEEINIIELCRDFEQHTDNLGIISNLEFLGSRITRNAYPVYKTGQTENIKKDLKAIEALGIYTAGRQGRFEYLSSNQAARQGREIAEEILNH